MTTHAEFGSIYLGSGLSDFVWKTYNGTWAERMRVTSAGNVGIGGTTPNSGKLYVAFGSGQGVEINDTTATNNRVFAMFESNGTGIGTITNNNNTAVAYNTSSDRRLKENIATTTAGLSTLMQIPVNEFHFISDSNKTRTQGFIAQDLYKYYPYAVTTNNDNGVTPLGASSTPWQVDYGRITPLIVRAVQELNLKIEDLATTTPEMGLRPTSFVAGFFAALKEKLVAWFASAANGISLQGAATSPSSCALVRPVLPKPNSPPFFWPRPKRPHPLWRKATPRRRSRQARNLSPPMPPPRPRGHPRRRQVSRATPQPARPLFTLSLSNVSPNPSRQ
jgi:Chaperone of endosialidase